MSTPTSGLHLRGERDEPLDTEVKLLTPDVYCIFLKNKILVRELYVLIFC